MSSYLTLLFKRTSKAPLETFEAKFNNIRIQQNKLFNYRKLFSLTKQQYLPLSYAFIAAFPYLLKVFADKRFGFSAIGLIHLSSEFIEHQALDYASPFDIEISTKQNITDERGQLIYIETNIYQNGILSVTNNNKMLKRTLNKSKANPAGHKQKANFTGELLDLVTANKVMRYAKLSGDFNPIHISSLMAKLLGFPKAIAHGMYLLNLAVAKANIQPSYVMAEFKKPCFIGTRTEINITKNKINTFSDKDKLHLDIAFRV